MSDLIHNFAGGAFVKVHDDGDWLILRCKSGGVETTLSLDRATAFDVAFALTPELGARFVEAKAARDALYQLSYPDARADQLRRVAKEIDCGRDTCDHAGGTTGLSCDKFNRGELCGAIESDDLVALAEALELKASLPPPAGSSP